MRHLVCNFDLLCLYNEMWGYSDLYNPSTDISNFTHVVSSHWRPTPMPHLAQIGMIAFFPLELLGSRQGFCVFAWFFFHFFVSCQGWKSCQEGSHRFCICTNISIQNLPKLPTEGKEPECGISQGKIFNGALIRKFITFAFDHNANSLRSAITYFVRQRS